jgi:hypothetical protein
VPLKRPVKLIAFFAANEQSTTIRHHREERR